MSKVQENQDPEFISRTKHGKELEHLTLEKLTLALFTQRSRNTAATKTLFYAAFVFVTEQNNNSIIHTSIAYQCSISNRCMTCNTAASSVTFYIRVSSAF